MFIETKRRSLLKAISWRIFATATTTVIVFAFFGRLDLAIAAGVVESITKIAIYFVHERIWSNIKYGKKKIEPFVLWFTGLPLSGKTTIADLVYKKLKKYDHLLLQRLDSKDIREMIPEIGYTKDERILHLKRVAFLIKTLQSNSISVIASFVTPYEEIRNFIRNNTKNFVEIYVKANLSTCMQRDYKGVYEKAKKGEIANLTGVHEPYEEPKNPELILDTERYSAEELADKVYEYVIKRLIK
ncbi:adenylyl-sulfate kinase [Hippea maritima]|uniref:Adenylyl-sulfate kinase n=1 Tax=Hippea maritima (strain ATCC 700847 / DSM 10411 / MH2) TaxID=760142 RepID=F2LWR0_HIPMA|nr:adenylyl-sulfate kinase [Hippea maritima]AEA33038.1 adenylylsulfate kinase [Hippea maritima DSM 10411]